MIGGSRSLVSFHMSIRVISTYNIIYSFNSPCKRERRPEIASSTPPLAIVHRDEKQAVFCACAHLARKIQTRSKVTCIMSFFMSNTSVRVFKKCF